jgi:hypothetical protein
MICATKSEHITGYASSSCSPVNSRLPLAPMPRRKSRSDLTRSDLLPGRLLRRTDPAPTNIAIFTRFLAATNTERQSARKRPIGCRSPPNGGLISRRSTSRARRARSTRTPIGPCIRSRHGSMTSLSRPAPLCRRSARRAAAAAAAIRGHRDSAYHAQNHAGDAVRPVPLLRRAGQASAAGRVGAGLAV